jgi:pyruvate ferredoxin oxidoreductase beta subunit
MALKIREIPGRGDKLAPGHRACAGCAGAVALRQVLSATDYELCVTCATGCMEVVTTIYPYTAWKNSYFHTAFENSAATCSGIETAYRALKKRGKLAKDREMRFIAFGGDGGTYDIGFQSLSGAMERGHQMLYVCYNNEAYMNTGIQRSGATPHGAATSTTPAGKVIPGKPQYNKDLTEIMVAHHIPYVAQASVHNYTDLMRKVQRALDTKGPAFLNILASCNRGWRIEPQDSISICADAVDTCFWPLYEVVNDRYKINYKPREKQPVAPYLKKQGRFNHLFKPGNEHVLAEIQAEVDRRWDMLLAKETALKLEDKSEKPA